MGLIAVVGGKGFIGERLSKALRGDGHDVRVVDVVAPSGCDVGYRRADVRDRSSLAVALQGSEVVYNLAAVHRDDVKPISLYDEVNVAGAINVCDVCRELGIGKIVFTSSVAVYGLAVPNTSEKRPPVPFNAYGRSKLRAEQVHREWQMGAPDSRSVVIVRPAVVFGEGNRGSVHQLVRQIIARRFIMVGNGRNRKSMAYVGNVSAFLVHALGLGAGVHLFNYTDGPDLSMHELVETILQELGRPRVAGVYIPYVFGYLAGAACDVAAAITGRRLSISAVRIRKFCSTTTFSAHRVIASGFRPPLGLRQALVKTIRYEARESTACSATS